MNNQPDTLSSVAKEMANRLLNYAYTCGPSHRLYGGAQNLLARYNALPDLAITADKIDRIADVLEECGIDEVDCDVDTVDFYDRDKVLFCVKSSVKDGFTVSDLRKAAKKDRGER